MRAPHNKRRRGSAMIEFVLVSGFFWVPLIYFMATTGFRLSRSEELIGLVNDVSQMFARGIDFSTAGNQTLLTGTLASTFSLQGNGGNAVTGGTTGNMVIVLSQYFYVNANDPSCGSCLNAGDVVLERRIIIGNKNLIGTLGSPGSMGTIPGADLNTTTGTCETGDNNLPPATTCQYTVTQVRVSNAAFNTIMNVSNLPTNSGNNVGGTVYFAEAYFTDITGRMIYQRSID
jgi:hypothetical protein